MSAYRFPLPWVDKSDETFSGYKIFLALIRQPLLFYLQSENSKYLYKNLLVFVSVDDMFFVTTPVHHRISKTSIIVSVIDLRTQSVLESNSCSFLHLIEQHHVCLHRWKIVKLVSKKYSGPALGTARKSI